MSETHTLKTWPTYFRSVLSGEKTFELRRDDRGFQKGDRLKLVEFEPGAIKALALTGRSVTKEITYILTGGQFGLEPGFVIMGLKDVDQ